MVACVFADQSKLTQSRGARTPAGVSAPPHPASVLVNLVLRAAGKDLLLAPCRDGTECFAADERLECALIRPLARDQVRSVIADVLPKRGVRVSFSGPQCSDDCRELLFEVRLF